MDKTTNAQRVKKRRDRLESQGICIYCGINKVSDKTVSCEGCKRKRRTYGREYGRKKREREGRGLTKVITEVLRNSPTITEKDKLADKYCHSISNRGHVCGGGYRVMKGGSGDY